ncbi:MAG: ribonuclease Y [Patescibacteria group bacterium]|nr:ribonuclease Y [Patescibacteria group bacterium]MDE2015223.1 ribonuclease Y [Patescibacteria group bacterium]MDE2227029.1 ribonuclease Y [Patescibacteria group bacterium]
MITTALIAAGLLLGFAAGYLVRRFWAAKKLGSLEERVRRASEEAETKAKEILLEAKDKAATLLVDFKKEEKDRRKEIEVVESRLTRREDELEKKTSAIKTEEGSLKRKEEELQVKIGEIKSSEEKVREKLEKVSGFSADKAKEELFNQIKEKHNDDLARLIEKIEKEGDEEIEKKSMAIITTAMQRYARSHVAEITTTVFPLADEELKGKIIGREGRNVRALERATGVEFVIDETPDSVIISSFDPYRREIARMALDKLIKDGRIQPAKIEEKVEEAKEEIAKRTQEIGESSAQDLGIFDLPKEILQLIGRLHFRTSYGQNVLTHSVEMAYVAGMLAAELGLNVDVAKRGALLHDIGKAIDQEVEGTHVELGRKILKKYSINEKVIEAMQSHHEDYPYAIPEAYVVTAADILSAARPGARRGTIESYIKRLGDLEKIAMEFPGVKSAYAISAGRELRVFVVPEKIDDFRALELAREIANKVQSELKYPGEIKVNVIREIRAVEYAR